MIPTLWEGYSYSLFLIPYSVVGNRRRLDVAIHSQIPAGEPWLMMIPRKKKVGLFHNIRDVTSPAMCGGKIQYLAWIGCL